MTGPATHTLLRLTLTQEFEYDADTILAFAATNGIGQDNAGGLSATIAAVFEAVYDSQLGNELFYGLDEDDSIELFTRREDEWLPS